MAFLLTKMKNFYIRMKEFHTNRKLVVFESDDWGSIRMPSKKVFEKLKELGDNPDEDAFLSNDCLESESDLLALYGVLASVHDKKGNFPIFTLNFAMANPDFENIDYENMIYKYEPFYQTYEKYYGKNRILETIKFGIDKKMIFPQLHCREHLNVGRWMRDLREHKNDTLLAFENEMIGVGASFHVANIFGYMDAFDTDCSSKYELEKMIQDSTEIFEKVFGFSSKTFVPSCFVWNNDLEVVLKKKNIDYIQSSLWQQKSTGEKGKYKLKRKLHYTGEKNKRKQIYGVRNCLYEPAFKQNPQESVQQCLKSVELAFKRKTPAIIGSHRFNYIGAINLKNRQQNLIGLKQLLETIVKTYSDVEFISTAELSSIILQEKK